jgi:hypothetical protein
LLRAAVIYLELPKARKAFFVSAGKFDAPAESGPEKFYALFQDRHGACRFVDPAGAGTYLMGVGQISGVGESEGVPFP